MRVLLTGGAGYIGSHTLRLLVERGDHVVVVDDLSNGVAERVGGVPMHRLDLADPAAIVPLTELLRGERIDTVVHFAARKRVDESVSRPAWYYRQNIGALAGVLEAMQAADVHRIVFSSSAAVYGATEGLGITETDATEPVNPYGATKLAGEQLVSAATHAFPLRAASLRYFNVAGAGWPELGDTAVLNLVPMVFERIDAGEPPIIFGDDYPTPDGTCVRDFVHVLDLAEAHVAMLEHLETAEPGHVIVNVGTGTGFSVREMVDAISRTAGVDLPPVIRERRAGDPASVVADPTAIRALTGWAARRGLDDIVQSAWASHLIFR